MTKKFIAACVPALFLPFIFILILRKGAVVGQPDTPQQEVCAYFMEAQTGPTWFDRMRANADRTSMLRPRGIWVTLDLALPK
mmetsp:Transcript_42657/g.78873  ORF Transcript_42657/g.78873 Transcript_42657/m.78873 type:complete len:82 (+) Transcript_42657:591-836(+)